MNELFNLILDLENAGVLFGLISVILTVRESIFSWYFGIINVILFGILFYNSKIYGQMILQIFFLFVSIYGLYKWKYGGKNGLELESRNISQLEQIISFFFILLLSGLIFIAINFVSSKEKFSF
ncbi:MAG TPA: nicotinamide riboside transporter PnuC, partial [Leptospiraceae bacterium]|nr:nicotinamide riboside transporter PnuC [Leptospiraceae bacterium]